MMTWQQSPHGAVYADAGCGRYHISQHDRFGCRYVLKWNGTREGYYPTLDAAKMQLVRHAQEDCR
jgi:hypothetical protein